MLAFSATDKERCTTDSRLPARRKPQQSQWAVRASPALAWSVHPRRNRSRFDWPVAAFRTGSTLNLAQSPTYVNSADWKNHRGSPNLLQLLNPGQSSTTSPVTITPQQPHLYSSSSILDPPRRRPKTSTVVSRPLSLSQIPIPAHNRHPGSINHHVE